jgi:DNA repair protein RadA
MSKKKEVKIPEPKTAWELYQEEQQIKRLSTQTPIDELIGGGIREDEVIEFYGEYGVGKTQIAFTLATQVASQEEGNVVYIDCENTFRPERIREIAQARGLDPQKILQKIHVIQPNTVEAQTKALDSIPKDLKPKLIIIDGVTTLFRVEYYGREMLSQRQPLLGKYLRQLKDYARENKTPIVITNQVYANPDGSPFLPLELRELAVGGHTLWHHIDNRIFIRKAKEGKRIARLVDSSCYPVQERTFIITQKGVEPLPSESE